MRIEADRLRAHVEMLAGEIGERNVFHPPALRAAAAYIEREWQAQGHAVERQVYVARGVESANLEVVRLGERHEEQILLVGAHYDSVLGSPGANDNASAVAVLLELGRSLAGGRFDRTVRLVAFVNEEPPFFYWGKMGSKVYAAAARERGDDIRLMVSLEMLGCFSDRPGSQRYPPLFRFFYPDRGNFVAVVSNLRSRRVTRRFVSALRTRCEVPVESASTFGWIPGVSWSDHLCFWKQGYPALMVTDTAFYRYRYYHSSEDTPEKLDYERMARLAEGLTGAVELLARTGIQSEKTRPETRK